MTVWTVMSLVESGAVGICGVFSSFEKAKEAAKKEMDTIQKVCQPLSSKLSETWETDNLGNNYIVYTNAPWEVVIRSWEVE